jgi:hypothetical protein
MATPPVGTQTGGGIGTSLISAGKRIFRATALSQRFQEAEGRESNLLLTAERIRASQEEQDRFNRIVPLNDITANLGVKASNEVTQILRREGLLEKDADSGVEGVKFGIGQQRLSTLADEPDEQLKFLDLNISDVNDNKKRIDFARERHINDLIDKELKKQGIKIVPGVNLDSKRKDLRSSIEQGLIPSPELQGFTEESRLLEEQLQPMLDEKRRLEGEIQEVATSAQANEAEVQRVIERDNVSRSQAQGIIEAEKETAKQGALPEEIEAQPTPEDLLATLRGEIANEAKVIAANAGRGKVTPQDAEQARQRILKQQTPLTRIRLAALATEVDIKDISKITAEQAQTILNKLTTQQASALAEAFALASQAGLISPPSIFQNIPVIGRFFKGKTKPSQDALDTVGVELKKKE